MAHFEFPSGIYRIKNAKAGTYLTGSSEEPNTVYGWESRPEYDYQKWDLRHLEGADNSAVYHIRNRGDARYLSINGVGTSPKVYKALENPTRWVLSDAKGTGEWYIAVEESNTVLTLEFGRQNNGTRIMSGQKDEACLQRKWRLKRINDKEADKLNPGELPASRPANSSLAIGDDEASLPEQLKGQYVGIIPPATYAIFNVSDDTVLNSNPQGSPDWDLRAGKYGYIFVHKTTGIPLGLDQIKVSPTEDIADEKAGSVEWLVVPSRAQRGYHILLAFDRTKFLGLQESNGQGGGLQQIHLSKETGDARQVWRFEMANV